MTDFNRTESIQRLTGNDSDRIVFDADLRNHQAHSIKCGVILVHAFWAGSSRRTLLDFIQSIVRVDTDRRLFVIVCDIDDIPALDPSLYRGDVSGGNGDVFWIANGQVVARHTASRACDFDIANQNLLQCSVCSRPDIAKAATEIE